MKGKIAATARKELETYFSSPVAFIFLGIFLVVSMFTFFWVNMFFVRNIADVRPLFEWMPVLLIFLVAALTMRMWSEERRMGSIEFLMTAPVKVEHLVLGKFLACMGLVAIALALTLATPVSVSFMGRLDWGPVVGAYLGSLLLAGAYTAIGLYVSSRNDNQIVSLMLTLVICFLFFLIGSQTVGGLVGNWWAEVFSLVGTGSRFESINRGMIDLRDLYYYLSLTGVFLTLNVYAIEKLRWSVSEQNQRHHRIRWVVALLIANLVAANFWLAKTHFFRIDLTQGRSYTISDASRGVIDQLQEPLLLRGYFSAKTHPKLAPLVPQIRDLMREYAVAGGGKVRAEFVDPREDPKIEEEANRKYSIKPVPFQVADKYQASLVNSYFDILVEYGDKYETLSFRDLIDIKVGGDGDLEVELRNLEYDLTRAVKKVLYGFQTTDNLFAAMKEPVKFVGFFSSEEKLPETIRAYEKDLKEVLDDIKKNSAGKFEPVFKDPQAGGGELAKEIAEKFGFRPMVVSLLDPNQFYFYSLLQSGDRMVEVPLPEDFTKEGARKSVEGALKRLSPGFLKTVGLVMPQTPPFNPYMPSPGGRQFRALQDKLSEGHTVKTVDLSKGTTPEDIDILVVLSPENFTDKQLFAVDQFLMKGGTVMLSTSPFGVSRTSYSELKANSVTSGLEEWLKSKGIQIEEKIVMDPDSEPYPVPHRRKAGPFTVEEIQLMPYLPFVDVRSGGLNSESLITARIPHVTMNWPSPLVIDPEQNRERKITELMHSSKKSWATASSNVQPDFEINGQLGFGVDGEVKPYLLAAVVEGRFESAFKGKDSPLLKPKEEKEEEKEAEQAPMSEEPEKKEAEPTITGVIEKSAESARLVVFTSNEFLTDQVLQISAMSGTMRYMNTLQVVENVVDWSLEDPALLTIRSRGHFTSTLDPMSSAQKSFWEYFNYAAALLGLLLVYLLYRARRARTVVRYNSLLAA